MHTLCAVCQMEEQTEGTREDNDNLWPDVQQGQAVAGK